ncbi:Os11g0420200 [Oryza sativa Japonica Group]|uniref:Os11g0420200 protein n=1 Tax=Oryza sativa subsp. japonica TaxID=39947 RepID=Q0IT36_ORYSJ|nr:Os11g0420200 [Oryza sativa Japonica Group]|eukprot:NP_001067766.2 Os11g0420200 [Oryza sativa Japonica Group]
MGSQLSCDGADHCNAGGGGCTKWIVSGVLASSKLLVDGDTTDQSGDQDLENGGQIVVLAYFISRYRWLLRVHRRVFPRRQGARQL